MKKLGKWMIGAALLCSLGTNVVTNVEDKAASYAYEIACEEDACVSVGAPKMRCIRVENRRI